MKIIFLIILLFLLPIVFAVSDLEECQRKQLNTNIPCEIISSFKPDTGCNQPISVYTENGTSIQNGTWQDSIPFCVFTWNISSPVGSYIYNSSIEDGVITVEKEDNMLAVTFSFILFICFFSVLGWVNQQKERKITSFLAYFFAFVELFMLVTITRINEAGDSIASILNLNFMLMLLVGGAIFIFTLFMKSLKMVQLDEDLEEHFTDEHRW